jgi:hypothetical protein
MPFHVIGQHAQEHVNTCARTRSDSQW